MRALDIIAAKRRGETHSASELRDFINAYVRGELPDYQMSAWLMAVCWRGMSETETAELTLVLAESGDLLDLSRYPQAVDKHSTGGVGDKTSLVLGPLLAACGATVAKMSGRGLGHTGGTVDKLESIPNFRSALSEEEFMTQADAISLVITGQSKDLAPADGLLYALRDATATVESLPLIASSIMSKKLAGGAKSLVLDVKVGAGAFMKTLDDARELAKTMIAIGEHAGRRVRCVLSRMEEPLGLAVGNALEVNEAVAVLKGEGPPDVRALCLVLAQEVLGAAGLQNDQAFIEEKLTSGAAYDKFEVWIAAQGGNVGRLGGLELAPKQHTLKATSSGYVNELNALKVGEAVKVLGGGRSRKEDDIDAGVGVLLHKKVGDEVEKGEALLTIYHRDKGLEDATEGLESAYSLTDSTPQKQPLILEIIREV